MNLKRSLLLALTLATLLSGCSSESGDELRYRIEIQYFNGGYTYNATSVNSMTVKRYYAFNPQGGHWAVSCDLNAYAIPIKLEKVTVFALLDRNAGEKADQSQCSTVHGTFWLYDQLHESSWIGNWNKLAKSQSKEFVQRNFYPRFMVVDQGINLYGGRIVEPEDLPKYGMEIKEMLISITHDELTKIRREIVDMGCDSSAKLGEYTAEQPECNSLIARNEDR